MKTRYKILIIITVGILFVYAILAALSSKKQVANPGTIQPTGPTISVPAQGGSLNVSDFTKNPQAVVGDTTVIEQNENFSIVYFSKDQSFLITILNQPAAQYRTQAENDLVSKLGISQTDACKLNVLLTVPDSVDSGLSGQNWGLSFCPSGQPFPQQGQ